MNKQMNQEEVWKKIEDYPEYEVSNRGKVRNIKFGRIIKCYMEGKGYLKQKNFSVSKLVAKYFIDNPNGYTKVGHIDRDPRNNNVENLRWETRSQNGMKKVKTKRETTSIYKGVSLRRIDLKWIAYINVNGKMKQLGAYESEIEAARAYDEAAKIYFKEFARLNFEDDGKYNEYIRDDNQYQKQKTSIYRGVYFKKELQKWVAYITVDKKKKYLGQFETELEAAQAYDIAAKELYKEFEKLNFKDEVNIQSEKIKNFNLQAILQKGKKQKTSIYRGVSFNKKTQKWVAQIKFNKMMKHLGYYETEIEAARAYDKVAKELHKEFANLNLNLNEDESNKIEIKQKKEKSSIYRGVSFHKLAQKWQAQIQINKKNKHLGLFETELEAARAYDKAAKELHKEFAKLNFKEDEELTEQLANLNINEDKQE